MALADDPAWTRTGFSFGGVPAVSYNTDEGLGLGAVGALYKYDGETSPYRWALDGVVTFTTKGVQNHSLQLDALRIHGLPLRILARAQLDVTATGNYCGPAESADCDPDVAEGSIDPDHYYRLRYTLPSLRLEGRWSFHEKPDEPSVFLLYRFSDLIPGTLVDGGPYPGSLYDADFPGGEAGITSVLQAGFMLDDRDFEPAPHTGYWLDASVRGASRFWGSDWEYFGADVTFRGYLPLGDRVTYADRVVGDGIWGDASTIELGTSGGEQRYDWFGSLNAGRGVRLRRYVGKAKAMNQAELRATVWSPTIAKIPVDLTLLAFNDLGAIASEWDALDEGVLVPTVGGGVRLAFDQNFIVRCDVGVSPVEDWSPAVYLDINNTF